MQIILMLLDQLLVSKDTRGKEGRLGLHVNGLLQGGHRIGVMTAFLMKKAKIVQDSSQATLRFRVIGTHCLQLSSMLERPLESKRRLIELPLPREAQTEMIPAHQEISDGSRILRKTHEKLVADLDRSLERSHRRVHLACM